MQSQRNIQQARILVTGGAGFIGSALVEKLLNDDNDVVVLDNFSTGRRENLTPFNANPHFTLIEGDIRDMETCRRAVDGVDYVLHEAALGSVPRSIDDPMTTTQVNIDGFVNILHAAIRAKVKRVVYASSSSVYGDIAESPKVEDHLGKALSPYAITKYVDELYARNFHELYGMETIGLRYFNVFGRRQNPNATYAAVIPQFAKAFIAHQSPVINGDGSITRDYTYIDNVVQANGLALACPSNTAANRVYNIACGQSTSLDELFALLRAALAEHDSAIAQIAPVYGPPRPGDVQHSLASIERAQTLLGYAPQFTVADGLRETAAWLVQHL